MHIILDISANTHRNDPDQIVSILDSIPKVPESVRVCVKTQFWHPDNPQGANARCTYEALVHFMREGRARGFLVGSSVFDPWAAQAVAAEEPDFVKIACRPGLRELAGYVPRRIPVLASFDCRSECAEVVGDLIPMICVPQYPADLRDYKASPLPGQAVSDHTPDARLYHLAEWEWYECHYCLRRSGNNPDSGPFARLPEDIAIIFEEMR
jgi:hypothetical protein